MFDTNAETWNRAAIIAKICVSAFMAPSMSERGSGFIGRRVAGLPLAELGGSKSLTAHSQLALFACAKAAASGAQLGTGA